MRRRHTGIIGVYYAWIQGRAGSDGDVAEFVGRTRCWRFMHAGTTATSSWTELAIL
jgi:hypothetical protein